MKEDRAIPSADARSLREAVRGHYTQRLEAGSCCSPGPDLLALEELPIDVPSFGCGDPNAVAELRPGETVLDLGSGAGLDAMRAAKEVGPTGRVIGVDMTPAMLERARAGAERLGLRNLEFREGLIEELPMEDASVDVVISNCVINLSADVGRVLCEAARVLRPGGRLRVSDTFRSGERVQRPELEGWCECEDGAHDPRALAELARLAGFVDVRVDPETPPVTDASTYGAVLYGAKPWVTELDADAADTAEALLRTAGLPSAGWSHPRLRRWGVRFDGRLVGVVALEVHGRHGLVRSLAVEPEARRRGFGGALLTHAVAEARKLGLRSVAGLTTTIPTRLLAWGFTEVTRDDLPLELGGSAELRGACPADARVFLMDLAGAGS